MGAVADNNCPLDRVAYAQLAEDMPDVGLRRLDGNGQLLGNFGVR
jgi:hypothetical protein